MELIIVLPYWCISRAISLSLVPQNLRSLYTQAITRAEYCALAVALYEKVTGTEIAGRCQFDDTNDVNVQKAGYIEVVNGTSPGKFTPNASLTREQAATMLARLAIAMGKPLNILDIEPFADMESVSIWANNAVRAMQSSAIMRGTGNNMFLPKCDYTREQSIVTILRMHDAMK